MKIRATQLYVRTRTVARAYLTGEVGAGMVEYALLVALIAIVLVVAVSFLGGELNDSFESITTEVESANNP